MAFRALVLSCILLLVSTSALAQRGPPGGGPPGGQGQGAARGGPGAGPGSPDGPGGPGGKPPHGPPLNLTAVGNLTADVGARLANCTADQKILDGRFHPASFKNATGNYNLLVESLLVDAAGGPPDSLAIVKGAVCDAAATNNADAATLDALLAVLPNASLPRKSGGGARGGSAGGARSGKGGRRMGRELLMRSLGRAARQGGQKQGGQQQQGWQQQQGGGTQQPPAGDFSGDGGVNSTVSGYAVLAGSSAAGVTRGGQLMGAKIPDAATAGSA
ncbi:unnamed protein product [Closterium sp. Naga37s-1]|nr:unnamed protein product [Closterium sp. Naga37s-1]